MFRNSLGDSVNCAGQQVLEIRLIEARLVELL